MTLRPMTPGRMTRRPLRTRPLRPKPLLLAVAVLLSGACSDGSDSSGDARGAPAADLPGSDAHAATEVTHEDFAGSSVCSGCHEDQYRRWAASTHGRAGGDPDPETVIAPFDGTPIVFRDGVVLPLVDSAGRYLFVVRQEGRPEHEITVDGVIGGGHMLGGGTQGFVTAAADGTARFLPFDFSRQLGRWFCNTGSRTGAGWVPVTPDMALADCGDWPPTRILGTLSRFTNCQSCHGSQITARLEPGTGVTTRWTSLDINCESCHGPARRHAELMGDPASTGDPADGDDPAGRSDPADTGLAGRVAGRDDPADIGLASRVTDGVEESLNICFQCHALKDVVQEGYLPGAPPAEYHAVKLPVLGDDPYLADGRVGTFAYQGTHLSSSCYVDGSMTCISCHEPHGLGYWDINRAPLADETDDRQCTSCHAAKATAPETHTFHPAASPGARCVSCHMPYLQHPEVGQAVPFARSDHTIPVPRPRLDGRLGLVSACRGCHTDRSELRLQAQADEWWGETKPPDRVTEGLLAVTDRMGADLAGRMLLHPDEPGTLARFRGLARFLTRWVDPGAGLGADATDRVARLADSPDPDLRALALATLHAADSAPGRDGADAVLAAAAQASAAAAAQAPPAAVAAEPVTVAAEPLAVRRRWVMILGFLSDEAMARGEAAEAEALLHRALAVMPDDPGVFRSLGLLHNSTGNYPAAIATFGRSLAADPNQPLVRVNLGIARAASGDAAGAVREYQAATALDPNEPLAWFNLANLRLRSDDPASAIRFYERAVVLGPELGAAHRNLALALARTGRVREAIPHARRAVEFSPGDETARDILDQLEAAAGRSR